MPFIAHQVHGRIRPSILGLQLWKFEIRRIAGIPDFLCERIVIDIIHVILIGAASREALNKAGEPIAFKELLQVDKSRAGAPSVEFRRVWKSIRSLAGHPVRFGGAPLLRFGEAREVMERCTVRIGGADPNRFACSEPGSLMLNLCGISDPNRCGCRSNRSEALISRGEAAAPRLMQGCCSDRVRTDPVGNVSHFHLR